jgi:flagellar hook-associated protein 1 FlgK
MSDLLAILNNAQSSLAAQRALVATASNNINNANTPGYSRQTAVLEAVQPAEQVPGAFIGRGAKLQTVIQARDKFLEAQVPQAFGSAAFSTAESDALQAYHGLDPNASGGLATALSSFYSALGALAQNPSDVGLRTSFLGASTALAQSFQSASGGIEAARSGLDVSATDLSSQINSEAAAVAQLNDAIRQASAGGGTPNDLLDQRQQHLDQLATLAGASFVSTSSGAINVMLPGGLALVSGDRAGSLSTGPNAPEAAGLPSHVGLLFTEADGSGPHPVANGSVGGKLGGTLAARDGALATAGAQIDGLASDLAAAVDAQHAAGFLSGPPNPAAAGGPLLDVGAGGRGAAARMTLLVTDPTQLALASSASGGSGDAGNANALLATQQASLPTSQADVQATVSAITAQFGSAAATVQAFASQDGAVKDHLVSMRESASGVSIDEEMISLQQAQRGYEAIARVIQTADQMMQTLLGIQ